MPVDQDGHGIGSLIVKLNNEYTQNFNQQFVDESTGDVNVSYVQVDLNSWDSFGLYDTYHNEQQTQTSYGFKWHPEGTRYYWAYSTFVAQDDLQNSAGPYQTDNTTAGWDTVDVSGLTPGGAPRGLDWTDKGMSLYVLFDDPHLVKIPAGTAYDITTLDLGNVETTEGSADADLIDFTSSGRGLHIVDDVNGYYADPVQSEVWRFVMDPPGDVTQADLIEVYDTTNHGESNPQDVRVVDNGERLIFCGDEGVHMQHIDQRYDLSLSGEVTNAKKQTFDHPAAKNLTGFMFSPNARRMWVKDDLNDNIQAFSLSANPVPVVWRNQATIDPGLGFDSWRQPNGDRPVELTVRAQAVTDGAIDGIIRLTVDESGGTGTDWSRNIAVAPAELGADAEVSGNIEGVTLAPGWSYRISNYQDPNSATIPNNIVQDTKELHM